MHTEGQGLSGPLIFSQEEIGKTRRKKPMNLTEGTQCMRVCAVVVAKCKVAATIKGNPDFIFRYCQNSYITQRCYL